MRWWVLSLAACGACGATATPPADPLPRVAAPLESPPTHVAWSPPTELASAPPTSSPTRDAQSIADVARRIPRAARTCLERAADDLHDRIACLCDTTCRIRFPIGEGITDVSYPLAGRSGFNYRIAPEGHVVRCGYHDRELDFDVTCQR